MSDEFVVNLKLCKRKQKEVQKTEWTIYDDDDFLLSFSHFL